MNHHDLLTQYQRLQRKLATAHEPWRSGRIDRLADALRAVEQQLQALRPAGVRFEHRPA